jgi:hypothetical protein
VTLSLTLWGTVEGIKTVYSKQWLRHKGLSRNHCVYAVENVSPIVGRVPASNSLAPSEGNSQRNSPELETANALKCLKNCRYLSDSILRTSGTQNTLMWPILTNTRVTQVFAAQRDQLYQNTRLLYLPERCETSGQNRDAIFFDTQCSRYLYKEI